MSKKINKRIILTAIFIVFVFVSVNVAYSQTSNDVEARKEQLQKELEVLEERIEEQRGLLQGKQRESVSLERDIAILEAQIQKKKFEIRSREITIGNLGTQIEGKTETIGLLGERLKREKKSLMQLLRKTRELDASSLVVVAFSNKSISGFFQDMNNFEAIQQELTHSVEEVRTTRDKTELEKESLEIAREEEVELKTIQTSEKKRIEANEAEKQRLYKITKGQEEEYQKILKQQEKTAAQIRAELFELRGTAAIPFGEALDYANFVSGKTGIRPAFLLAVIAEESNLGENLGSGTWTQDMHPDRDRPVFEIITETLGYDPDKMPVSKKPWYGWGGAMGPAQFIPSTWACYGGYVNATTDRCGRNPDRSWVGPWRYEASRDRIRKMLDKNSPSDPWIPRDAFMASGMLLQENEAVSGDYESERLAALRYFAGWTNANKSAYAFYGDDVMNLASKYQAQINILQGN